MGILDKIKTMSQENRDNLQGTFEVGMVGSALAGATLFALGAFAFIALHNVRNGLRLDPNSVKLLASHKKLVHFVTGFTSGGFAFLLPIVPLAAGDIYLDSLNNKKTSRV